MVPIEIKHLYTFNEMILFYVNIFNEDDDEFCYDEEISQMFKIPVETYKERIKKAFDKSCIYKGEIFLHCEKDTYVSDDNIRENSNVLKKIDEEILNKYKEEFTTELTLLVLNN